MAELRKIYGYAEWCFRQKETDLWNAAGVGFYEHLCDEVTTCNEISQWLKLDIFEGVADLLEGRMDKKAFTELRKKFSEGKHRQSRRGSTTD